MKGKSIRIFIVSFFTFFIVFLPTFVKGQGGPGGGGDPACDPQCNCRPDGSVCPIDSYLYVLLGIGIFYGIKKARDQKKTAAASE